MESSQYENSEKTGPVELGLGQQRQRLQALLDQVIAGCPDAALQLQNEYGDYIVRAVRRRLPRRLRPKFDSIDFVQDVWASFFRTHDHEFNGPEHLIAFLTRVAQNKVNDATREGLQTTKRDARRERPLATVAEGQRDQKLFARDATPSETAIGHELWDLMLRGEPPVYRAVLMMLRDGRTQQEVADQLKLSRKTVQRILGRALEKATP